MKNILSVLLVFISLAGFSQSTEKISSAIDLIGVWSLYENNQTDSFEDIWEFTAEHIFNELKSKQDGDTALVPDENGTWKLEQNKLTITITGEETNGVQKPYETPQVVNFEISKEGDALLLVVMREQDKVKGKTTALKLVSR